MKLGKMLKRLSTIIRRKKKKKTVQPSETVDEAPAKLPSQPSRSSQGVIDLVFALIPNLLLFLDSSTIVNLARCHRQLYEACSSQSRFWKTRFLGEFQFDKDDRELDWLQQFRERRRIAMSSATPRAPRSPVDMDWFQTYCCRQQTEYNLAHFTPYKREISLPPEYINKDWKLKMANPLCFVFWSRNHSSFLVYQPVNPFKRSIADSPSLTEISAVVNPTEAGRFYQLRWGARPVDRYDCLADGDTVLIRIEEDVTEQVIDATSLIWSANQHRPLEVRWPYNSDISTRHLHHWNVKTIRQGWVIAHTKLSDEQYRLRIYNIPRARWCSGVVSSWLCHFQMTDSDSARIFCYSREYLNSQWQLTWQLWEFRSDGAMERCVQSGTLSQISDKRTSAWNFRLNNQQSVIVCIKTRYSNTPDAASTLTFHQNNSPNSISREWQVIIPGDVRKGVLLAGRRELFIAAKNGVARVLDISNGATLRRVNLALNSPAVLHAIGKMCGYKKRDGTDQRLVDTQTGRDIVVSDKRFNFGRGSLRYGRLCVEKGIRGGRLTMLDWYS